MKEFQLTTAVDLDPKEYVQTLDLLKKIDFLQGVSDDNLRGILLRLQKQTFGKSKKILFQGEIANQLFIIRKGSIEISTRNKGNKLHLADMVPPMYFGEISLLRPTSATATVTSGEEGAEVLILTHEAMSSLSKKIPDIAARIQKVIDARLSQKNAAKKADSADEE